MEVTLKVLNCGASKGTVGYLTKHAASIRVGNAKPQYDGDQTRHAWLLDHDGNTITWLASSVGERLEMHEGYAYDWTEAAREVLYELMDIAEEILANEDSEADRPTFALQKH